MNSDLNPNHSRIRKYATKTRILFPKRTIIKSLNGILRHQAYSLSPELNSQTFSFLLFSWSETPTENGDRRRLITDLIFYGEHEDKFAKLNSDSIDWEETPDEELLSEQNGCRMWKSRHPF
ncbi:hypothetical protein AVEN_221247-1 [Araneus ventricosus]|uniref:Uncharacterized protein n=1 Tax=Araneus ventricosus TaxID=182803 RepID=A0A4Y2F5K0_ARAVE|nr:hypothetical protein AVEN_221247-1 [Araneus ventricosus]